MVVREAIKISTSLRVKVLLTLGGGGVENWAKPYLKGTLAPNRYLLSKKSASKGGGEGLEKSQQKTDFFNFDSFPNYTRKLQTIVLFILLLAAFPVANNSDSDYGIS